MIDYKSRLCISRNTKWICTFSYFVPAAVIIIVLIIVYNSEFLNINNLFFFVCFFFCCKDFVYYLSPYRKGGENKRGDNLVIFYKQKKKTNHQFGRAAKGRTRLRKNHKIKLERKKPPSSLFYFLSFPIFFFLNLHDKKERKNKREREREQNNLMKWRNILKDRHYRENQEKQTNKRHLFSFLSFLSLFAFSY